MKNLEQKAEEYLKNKQKGGEHIVATRAEAIHALSDFANKMIQEIKAETSDKSNN